MSEEKFSHDVQTVLKFIQLYCNHKHTNQKKESMDIFYQDKNLFQVSFHLCPTCKETFLYSLERLQNCPHEPKPACRKCENPCYERLRWKDMAKIMRYSGMKLGLLKIKNIFTKNT